MWWLRVGNRRGKHSAPPLQGHVPLGPHPLGTAENRRVVPSSAGAGSVNLKVQVTRFLLDRVCVFARSAMVWGARLLQQRDGEHLRSVQLGV